MSGVLQPSAMGNNSAATGHLPISTPSKLGLRTSEPIPWSSSPADMRIRPARSATARLTGPTRTDASSSFAPTFPSAGGSSHPPPAQPSFAAKAPSPPAPAPKPVQVDSPRTRRRKAVFGDDAVAPLPKAEPSLLYARAQHEPVPSSSKLPPAAPPAPRPSTARPTSTMSTAHVSAAKARSDLTRAVSPPRRPGATAPARESERPSTSAATTESKKRPWEAGNSEAQKESRRKLASFAYGGPDAQASTLSASSSGVGGPKHATSIKAKVTLSAEQQQILQLVLDGMSLFFTGSAGTGKSVLLREIIQSLRRKFSPQADVVAVTASTGIAACNIGGSTIHSFAGIGLGIETAEELAKKVRKNRKAAQRWARTKVWIIDEVSMLDGDLFDKLSQVGQILRKKPEPFGGIQVIVTGDFFQLPPVSKGVAKFAFEAKCWTECVKRTVNLNQVFRQKDQIFVDMLNEMRFGKMTARSIDRFKSLTREVIYPDGIEPTELFPRREEVERSNSTRLGNLRTDEMTFNAIDGGAIVDVTQRDKLLSHMLAPPRLTLRIDSQVMLIKNVDDQLVNGSIGKVIAFMDTASWLAQKFAGTPEEDGANKKAVTAAATGKTTIKLPVVRFVIPGGHKRDVLVAQDEFKVELPSGEVQASRKQVPLVLSWAMSIHKSQGQTLERVKVDLRRIFEKGQAYVALSRATSLDALQVIGFDAKKVQCHPKVSKWSEGLECLK